MIQSPDGGPPVIGAIALAGPNTGRIVATAPIADVVMYVELPVGTFGNGPAGVLDRTRQPGAVMVGHVDTNGAPVTVGGLRGVITITPDDLVTDQAALTARGSSPSTAIRRRRPRSPASHRRRRALTAAPCTGRRSARRPARLTTSRRRCSTSSRSSIRMAPASGTRFPKAGRWRRATSAGRSSSGASTAARSSWRAPRPLGHRAAPGADPAAGRAVRHLRVQQPVPAAPLRLRARRADRPAAVASTIDPALQDDGFFGPLTDRAVRRYQQANGLEVDGLVGRNTWRSLTEGRIEGNDADGSGLIDPWELQPAVVPGFPPANANLTQGGTTWAVVLAGSADFEDPALQQALGAASDAGYVTGPTDCDRRRGGRRWGSTARSCTRSASTS